MTDTHLCVALEYAAGGELFDTVARAGKLPEIEARYFFQQLVLGLEYCHRRVRSIQATSQGHCCCILVFLAAPAVSCMYFTRAFAWAVAACREPPFEDTGTRTATRFSAAFPLDKQGVVHRDLKLENLLLDGSPQRHLKIADFGYSKVHIAAIARWLGGIVRLRKCSDLLSVQPSAAATSAASNEAASAALHPCFWTDLPSLDVHARSLDVHVVAERLPICALQNMYASQPKSTVGTVAYIAPEVLTSKRDSAKYKVSLWSRNMRLPPVWAVGYHERWQSCLGCLRSQLLIDTTDVQVLPWLTVLADGRTSHCYTGSSGGPVVFRRHLIRHAVRVVPF